MATDVTLEYCVEFGRGDYSDWIEYDITLEGEAEKAYLEEMAKEDEYERCFSDHEALTEALGKAYAEIAEQARQELIDAEDEYAEEEEDPFDGGYTLMVRYLDDQECRY